MINLFDLAKELDEAISAQQGVAEVKTSATKTASTEKPAATAQAQAQAASTDSATQPAQLLQFAQAYQAKPTTTDASPAAPEAVAPKVAPAVRAQQEQARLAAEQAQRAQAQALKAQMQAEAAEIARLKLAEEKAEREYVAGVRAKAFREIELDAFPMTPEHIKKLRQKLDETQRATEVPAGTPPKPVSTSLIVNLSPGTTPPVIRLGKGLSHR